MDEKV
jgi:hypothetical protein